MTFPKKLPRPCVQHPMEALLLELGHSWPRLDQLEFIESVRRHCRGVGLNTMPDIAGHP